MSDDYVTYLKDGQSPTAEVSNEKNGNKDNYFITTPNATETHKKYSLRSSSAQQSLSLMAPSNEKYQLLCSTPNYDSGNFTYSNSNASDSSLQAISNSSSTEDDETDSDHHLQGSNDTLNLSNQGKKSASLVASKLKSELERTIKSEQWYKNELKSQKRMRLELLERLYLNEHKFIKENQTLKIECDRLNREKESLTKKLHELEKCSLLVPINQNHLNSTATNPNSVESMAFELQKQKNMCKEYETINSLLKKQKMALLNDLGVLTNVLTNERDTKIALFDAKNFKITQKCARLIEENKSLHENISKAQKLLIKAKDDLQRNEIDFKKLKSEYNAQIDLIKNYEKKIKFNKSFKDDTFDISILNTEIFELKRLHQENLEALEKNKIDLNNKNEKIENLHKIHDEQVEYIKELKEEIFEYKRLKENLDKYVNLLEMNNRELDTKQSEIDELRILLINNKSKIEQCTIENLRLRENIDQLNIIRNQKELALNVKSKEVSNLNELVKALKPDSLNKALIDRDTSCESRIELNSTLKMNEIEELKKIIQDQREEILRQNSELLNYQKKIDDIHNQLQFERSEFVRQSSEIQKVNEENIERIIQEKNSSHDVDDDRKNGMAYKNFCPKSHRVSINLELFNENDQNKLSHTEEFNEHVHNIEMIKTLLAQKSEKMTMLCEEQQKWERVLENLSEIQEMKSVEQDDEENSVLELNEKSGDQLIYLEHLKEKDEDISQKQCEIESLRQDLKEKTMEVEELTNNMKAIKVKHEQHLKEMNQRHDALEKAMKDELHAKLIEFEIFKPVLGEQENKLKTLEGMLKTRQKESEELKKSIIVLRENEKILQQKVEELEKEKIENITNIKKLQDIAIRMNQKVPETKENECQAELSDESATSDDGSKNFKIMKKVMEAEHHKNIVRYELHIRTLLGNVKSYKKNLEIIENRYKKLSKRYKELEEKEKENNEKNEQEKESKEKSKEQHNNLSMENRELDDFIIYEKIPSSENKINNNKIQAKCLKCLEIEAKCNENTRKLSDTEKQRMEIENQLETVRKQFQKIDDYGLKINSSNLIDDYKTILQPFPNCKRNSSFASCYEEILELIKRSNNFTPNFDKLTTSIDDLKDDIKRFKNSYAIGGASSRKRSLSLADELRAAETLNCK